MSTGWVIGSSDPATAASIVYPYTKNGQTTIELNRNPSLVAAQQASGGIYEIDGQKTPISAGDQVTYHVWLSNEAPTTSEPSGTGYWGSCVGIDLWTSNVNGRICEVRTPNGVTTYPTYPSLSATYIPFGTTNITEITISFTVQPQYEADPWGSYTAGTMVTPTYIIPWIYGESSNSTLETARTWIFATELYVTPP